MNKYMDLVAKGADRELWSMGPYRRPSKALRAAARFLDTRDAGIDEEGCIAAVDGVRLDRIGKTYWVVVELDTASMCELATDAELRLIG